MRDDSITGRALLTSLKPDIIKKPLERRVTRTNRNKENVPASSNTPEVSENVIVTLIREKYNKQIESVGMDHITARQNIAEQRSVSTPAKVNFILS